MRLREDPNTSSALRLALEEDSEDFPPVEAIRALAETIHLRLRTREPVRLSARADTPRALRAALLAESSLDSAGLRDVWKGIRRAVNAEAVGPVSTCQRGGLVDVVALRRSGSLVVRHGRRGVLVAAAIVMFSTLAAAGLKWFGERRFESSPKPPSSSSIGDGPRVRQHRSVRPSSSGDVLRRSNPVDPNVAPDAQPRRSELAPLARTSSKITPAQNPTGKALLRPQGSTGSVEDNSVVAESNLLRRAWAALRTGQADVALGVARAHAVQFPQGVLAQEREVVEIQALEQMGRTEEARRRAMSFARHFPDSPHRPLVDAGPAAP
ncbi:MAG: hypothetical protein QM784_08780 [Polyangiaceae bacterium]